MDKLPNIDKIHSLQEIAKINKYIKQKFQKVKSICKEIHINKDINLKDNFLEDLEEIENEILMDNDLAFKLQRNVKFIEPIEILKIFINKFLLIGNNKFKNIIQQLDFILKLFNENLLISSLKNYLSNTFFNDKTLKIHYSLIQKHIYNSLIRYNMSNTLFLSNISKEPDNNNIQINTKLRYENNYKKLKKMYYLNKSHKKLIYLLKKNQKSNQINMIDKLIYFNILKLTRNEEIMHSLRRRYLVNYVKDTKKILVYDAKINKMFEYKLDISFTFYRDSEGIEICLNSKKELLVIISGGGDANYRDDIYIYNCTNNTMEKMKMKCCRGYHGCIAHKGYLFLLGGSANQNSVLKKFNSSVEFINIDNLTKRGDLPDLKYPRSDPGIEIVQNKLFVIGGVNFHDGDPLQIEFLDIQNLIEKNVFDPLYNEWQILKIELPKAIYGSCAIKKNDQEIYIFGGLQQNDNEYNPDVFCLNIYEQTICFVCTMSEHCEYINCGTYLNENFVLFDFNNQKAMDYSIHFYNSENNIWSVKRKKEFSLSLSNHKYNF